MPIGVLLVTLDALGPIALALCVLKSHYYLPVPTACQCTGGRPRASIGHRSTAPSERRTEAVHQLPKLRTRVRFPSLALAPHRLAGRYRQVLQSRADLSSAREECSWPARSLDGRRGSGPGPALVAHGKETVTELNRVAWADPVAVGEVGEDGLTLAYGTMAGAGDVVTARKNARSLRPRGRLGTQSRPLRRRLHGRRQLDGRAPGPP